MSESQEPGQRMFEANLHLIRELIFHAARRHRLRSQEVEEFSSYVWLKMIEDDYRILRRFSGTSSLRAFLTTVVHRLLLDFRIQAWGKWRPSAEVRRFGSEAEELERLLSRDGHSLENALEILRGRQGSSSREELLALAGKIPARARPRREGMEVLSRLATGVSADEGVLERERKAILRTIMVSLAKALLELPVQDRFILRMRYGEGWTVRKIASALEVEDRRLYRRFERCLGQLRRTLERQGIGRDLTAGSL